MNKKTSAFLTAIGLVAILVSQSAGADWSSFMDMFKSEGKRRLITAA